MKMQTPKTDNNLEGYGNESRELHTPPVMRDCIKARYWDNPAKVELFKIACRLADDFKRRGFSRLDTLAIIENHLNDKLDCGRPEHIKKIEAAVSWVYKKQEHPLTCTGALFREGLCHKSKRRCHFNEQEKQAREWVGSINPVITPTEIEKYMAGLHPTDALYARWTYLEFIYLERERNLMPGSSLYPIFIGYRKFADRVNMRNNARGYTKDTALNSIRLLEDNGFIKRVIQGKSGTRQPRPLANGYIRVMPASAGLSRGPAADNRAGLV